MMMMTKNELGFFLNRNYFFFVWLLFRLNNNWKTCNKTKLQAANKTKQKKKFNSNLTRLLVCSILTLLAQTKQKKQKNRLNFHPIDNLKKNEFFFLFSKSLNRNIFNNDEKWKMKKTSLWIHCITFFSTHFFIPMVNHSFLILVHKQNKKKIV